MKRAILLLGIFTLISVAVTFAQQDTRWGVAVTVAQVEGLGRSQEEFIALIPSSWLAPTDGLPRYDIHIAPSIEDVQLCVFDPGGTAISRRVNLDITITDIETNQSIFNQSFSGIAPPACSGGDAPPAGTTVSVFYPQLVYSDLVPSLARVMAGTDLPGTPYLVIPGFAFSTTFSPDGLRVATITGSDAAVVRVFDAVTGETILEFRDEELAGIGRLWSINYSPDGSRIVTGSLDIVTIWDANTGEQLLEITATGSASSVDFSPDGTMIATTTAVWNANTGQELFQLNSVAGNSVEYSPDGLTIVTASSEDGVRIWDAVTGAEVLRIFVDDGAFSTDYKSASYNPDGTQIVTTSLDTTIRVWSAASGEQLIRIESDTNLGDAVFSPNGRYLVTKGFRSTRIWDATSGEQTGQLFGPLEVAGSIDFSPDGTGIVVADGLNVFLWNVSDIVDGVMNE